MAPRRNSPILSISWRASGRIAISGAGPSNTETVPARSSSFPSGREARPAKGDRRPCGSAVRCGSRPSRSTSAPAPRYRGPSRRRDAGKCAGRCRRRRTARPLPVRRWRRETKAATDVPGNSGAYHPAARAARAGMRVLGQMRQATTGEVRLDERKAARLSASAQSIGGFDRLLRTRCAICHCPRRPKGRPWPPTTRKPGNVGLRKNYHVILFDPLGFRIGAWHRMGGR